MSQNLNKNSFFFKNKIQSKKPQKNDEKNISLSDDVNLNNSFKTLTETTHIAAML